MKTDAKNTINKRAFKKQINIKWNSRLFFQLGVIVSMLFVFFVMQTNFEYKKTSSRYITPTTVKDPPMIDYVLDIEKPKPIEQPKKVEVKPLPTKTVVSSSVFDVKKDDSPAIETNIAPTDAPVIEAPVVATPAVTKTPTEAVETKSLLNVEFVPVYPGCESLASNNEKIDCMSSKINDFINSKFRKSVLEDLEPGQAHKIYVKFKIDASGYITEVVANSHNANLKKEAQRVIANLPTMKPGRQGDKNVDVIYTVPIVFNVY